MPRVSNKKIDQLVAKYHIDTNVISKETLRDAIMVELEHGKRFGAMTNIINDDIELALRIAMAHLTEYPNYYLYLNRMEIKLDAYWSKRTKPFITLNSNKKSKRFV